MKTIKILFTYIFIFAASVATQAQDVYYPDWDMNGSDMARFVGDEIATQLSSVFLEQSSDENSVSFLYKTHYDSDFTMMSAFKNVVNGYNDIEQLNSWSSQQEGIICTAFRIVDFDKSIYGVCFSEEAEVYSVTHMEYKNDKKRTI